MKKVILFLCLLPMFGYGQVKLNDGSTVTTKFIGKDAQPISIGAHPLRNVQQSQPKIYNEATPKVLSLEEKLLLYAQECNDNPKKVYYARLLEGNFITYMAVNGVVQKPKNDINYNDHQWHEISKQEYTSLNKEGFEFRTEYIHREPTFMGFIEWLKKK